MQASQVTIIVAVFVLTDLIVIPLILRAVINGSWGELERANPARPVAPDAVVREFESLQIGSANFGWSVHIAVDAGCLHLRPARFMRWFGAGPIAIPWEKLTDVSPARRGKYASASVSGKRLTMPAWALELARSGSANDGSP